MFLALSDARDDLTAIVALMLFVGLPIAYAIAGRWWAHQERMEMLRRGIVPPPDPKWAKQAAKHGWYSQTPFNSAPPPGAPPTYDPYEQARADRYLRKGITLAMIGLALLIGLSFIDNLAGTPGPWLLGGLIPLFAGIAQIIIALLSGARFSMVGGGARYVPGPEAQPQAPYQQADPTFGGPPPRDVTPGPYAWRPGSTTELEPGSRPPDKI